MPLPDLDNRDQIQGLGQGIEGGLERLQQACLVLGVLVGLVAVGIAATLLIPRGVTGDPGLGLLEVFAALLGVALTIAATLLWRRALWAAQRAISAVRDFAVSGRSSVGLNTDLGRFETWLTAGQWLTAAGALLNLVGTLLAGGEAGDGSRSAAGASLIVSLLQAGLTWVILGAVKTFFMRVRLRSQGPRLPLYPAAQSAQSWLTLSTVTLWLGLGLSVLGGIGTLVATVLPSLALPAARRAAMGPTLFGMSVFMIALFALVVWLYLQLIGLMNASRTFAGEVAEHLDDQARRQGRAQVAVQEG